jgi:hypothetical protein
MEEGGKDEIFKAISKEGQIRVVKKISVQQFKT